MGAYSKSNMCVAGAQLCRCWVEGQTKWWGAADKSERDQRGAAFSPVPSRQPGKRQQREYVSAVEVERCSQHSKEQQLHKGVGALAAGSLCAC